MLHPPGQPHDEWHQVQLFLSGQPQFLEHLVQCHGPTLIKKLIRRGATHAEAEDVVASLWSEAVPRGAGVASLLEKYNGQTALGSWLLTVATRRLIDLKRRQRFVVSAPKDDPGGEESCRLMDSLPAPAGSTTDGALVDLLRHSLRQGFSRCSPEELLMLQLVHVHGLTQRELSRMWGWTESRVSRSLTQALKQIQAETVRQVRQHDPWLQLTWEDFVDLCQTEQLAGWIRSAHNPASADSRPVSS